MKGNGLGAIKQLALKHAEKVVMLLVVACAGYLVYATLSHESLPQSNSADNLTQKANNVKRTMDDYKWEDALQGAPGEYAFMSRCRLPAAWRSTQTHTSQTAISTGRSCLRPSYVRIQNCWHPMVSKGMV